MRIVDKGVVAHYGPQPDLKLPDGTPCETLRQGKLFEQLSRMAVPNIDATMPKGELMQAYRNCLEVRRERFLEENKDKWMPGANDA